MDDEEDVDVEMERRLDRAYCQYRAKGLRLQSYRVKDADRKYIRKAVLLAQDLELEPEKFIELTFLLFPIPAGPLPQQLYGDNPRARLENYLATANRTIAKEGPDGQVIEKAVTDAAHRLASEIALAMVNVKDYGTLDVLDLLNCAEDVMAFCKHQAGVLGDDEARKVAKHLKKNTERLDAHRELEYVNFLARLGFQ